MAYKYLLSTGQSTTKIEEYVIDLFKIFLQVNPSDIPHKDSIGFDFVMTNVMKDRLKSELNFRVTSLIKKISERFNNSLTIKISSLDLIDEEKAKLIIDVNGLLSEEFNIDLYTT